MSIYVCMHAFIHFYYYSVPIIVVIGILIASQVKKVDKRSEAVQSEIRMIGHSHAMKNSRRGQWNWKKNKMP